jgi:hypothetical protein
MTKKFNVTTVGGEVLNLDGPLSRADACQLAVDIETEHNIEVRLVEAGMDVEIFYARESQLVNGAPLLQLDLLNVFRTGGVDGMLREYPDLALIVRVWADGFEQVYGGCWPCVDPQIEQIMSMLAEEQYDPDRRY